MNEIIEGIAEQINARELKFAKFQLLVDYDTNTVTVKKGSKFIEIHYNEVSDLYNLNFGKINKFSFEIIRSDDMIYFDQLQNIIEKYFNFEYVMKYFINNEVKG